MRKFYLLFTFVFICHLSNAQSDTLQVRFDQLVEKSETFKQYKLIVDEKLDEFWVEVQDSIKTYQQRLKQEMTQSSMMKNELETSRQNAIKAEDQIAALNQRIGSLNFLGMSFSEGVYHTLVWTIILLLVVGTLMVYGMSMRSRVLAKTSAAEFKSLQSEFEQYKERARTKEAKVKRELQTALNQIEELKRGIKK